MAATHYKLSSAMRIGDSIRVAGSIVTASEAESLEQFNMLIDGEHLVPCGPPLAPIQVASPFPKRGKRPESSEG
jgi:hypothetical protein